jgi:cysteine synthase
VGDAVARRLGRDKVVVIVLPDTSERYLHLVQAC